MDTEVINEYMADMEIPDNHLRIAIVGKTGQGKSSTLNSMLGQNRFMSKQRARAVTQKCQRETIDKRDYTLVLVDTPGMFDPATPLEETQREIERCINLTLPGPHIVLFAIRMDCRISTEDGRTFDAFIHQFGSGIMQHLVIILTHYDSLKECEDDPNEFIRDVKNIIPSLETHQKFVPFDNKLTGTEAEEQLNQLMDIIINTYQTNNRRFYTNEQYLVRAKEICEEKRKEEICRQLEKEKEMQHVKEEEGKRVRKEQEEEKQQLFKRLEEERQQNLNDKTKMMEAKKENEEMAKKLNDEKRRRKEAEDRQRDLKCIITAVKITADMVFPGAGLLVEGAQMFNCMIHDDEAGVKEHGAGLVMGAAFLFGGNLMNNSSTATKNISKKTMVQTISKEAGKEVANSGTQIITNSVVQESVKQITSTSTKALVPRIICPLGDVITAVTLSSLKTAK